MSESSNKAWLTERIKARGGIKIEPLSLKCLFEGDRLLSITFEKYNLGPIAEEIISIFARECGLNGAVTSPGTGVQLFNYTRALLVYLAGAEGVPTSLSQINASHISEFERHLAKKYNANSNTPMITLNYIRRFFDVAKKYTALDPSLIQHIALGRAQFSIHPSEPREPYSKKEARNILAAAIDGIKISKEKINSFGAGLLNRGVDPGFGIWDCPEKAIWVIYNQNITIANGNKSAMEYNKNAEDGYKFADLVDSLYLNPYDIFAFATAISLDIGIPIESVYELKSNCLANRRGSMIDIRYVKRRRNGSNEATSLPISVEGEYSAVKCIELLLELTQAARDRLPSDQSQWLFLGHSKGRISRIKQRPTIQFCRNHVILDASGERMTNVAPARYRKTVKARDYVASGGASRKAGDHSSTTHALYYASVDALMALHEETLDQAFKDAFNQAMLPVVVPADKAAGSHPPVADDLGIASCRDMRAPPHASKADGGLCQIPFWGCLSCQNAVITASHLPVILGFQQHLLSLRDEIPLDVWASRYGALYAQIETGIIGKFSPQQVGEAKAIASGFGNAGFWLPAERMIAR